MNEIARMFGQGATYDAVEGQLRKAKTLAKELTEEAKDRPAPAKALSRMKSTASVKSRTLQHHIHAFINANHIQRCEGCSGHKSQEANQNQG